jgi:hypothetical protein
MRRSRKQSAVVAVLWLSGRHSPRFRDFCAQTRPSCVDVPSRWGPPLRGLGCLRVELSGGLDRADDRAPAGVELLCAGFRASDVAVASSVRADGNGRRKSRFEGIVLRHSRTCVSRDAGRCSCAPGFQAQVWSARERKTIRKTFRSLAEARALRPESQVALRKGTLRSSSRLTLREAAVAWLAAAEAGVVRTRAGERYKPAAARAYRQASITGCSRTSARSD